MFGNSLSVMKLARPTAASAGGEWQSGRGGAGRGALVPSLNSVLEPGHDRGDRMVDIGAEARRPCLG